jgi:hypothetical protein
VNPTNVAGDDAAYAVADTTGSIDDVTEYMKVTTFGFTIPSGATIDGIEAGIKRKTNTSGVPIDNIVKIVKAGAISGTDQSAGAAWPTSEATATFGGSSNLWGLAWTDTDINASNFGVAFSATDTSVGNWIASINYITLTIYYTVASTSHSLTLVGVGS